MCNMCHSAMCNANMPSEPLAARNSAASLSSRSCTGAHLHSGAVPQYRCQAQYRCTGATSTGRRVSAGACVLRSGTSGTPQKADVGEMWERLSGLGFSHSGVNRDCLPGLPSLAVA